MTARVRYRAGAPNEVRFGFAQAVAVIDHVWIAGQVAKDNATGLMHSVATMEEHLELALDNVRAVARAADGAHLVYVQAHVVGDAKRAAHRLAALLGARTAIATVAVDALSHPDYLAELSAVCVKERGMPITLGAEAVRAGPYVYVAGCPARSFDEAVARLSDALTSVNAVLADLVWTHVFVAGPVSFDTLATAHRNAFGAAPPAVTLIPVRALGDATATVMISGAACTTHNQVVH